MNKLFATVGGGGGRVSHRTTLRVGGPPAAANWSDEKERKAEDRKMTNSIKRNVAQTLR